MEINLVMRMLGNIERGYDSLEEVISNAEEIGYGTECTAYDVGGYCVKDYGNDSEAQRQKDIWELCPKSNLTPKIYGVVNGFLVMEMIKGELVERYLGDEKITVKVVDTLKKFTRELLELGIIAYDLHPENVMYTDDGEVKVIDVGFFATLDEEEENPYNAMRKSNKRLNNWYKLEKYYSSHGEPEYARVDKDPFFKRSVKEGQIDFLGPFMGSTYDDTYGESGYTYHTYDSLEDWCSDSNDSMDSYDTYDSLGKC